MELICVVMGARAASGPQSSFGIASRLMSEAYSNWRLMTAVTPGQTVGQAPVTDGRAKTVAAVAAGQGNLPARGGGGGAVQGAVTKNGGGGAGKKGPSPGTPPRPP